MISKLETRLETLHQSIAEITGRFAERDNEGTQLVKAVVKSASVSGMEMTGAAEKVAKKEPEYLNQAAIQLRVIS